jgi:hypothetical protein
MHRKSLIRRLSRFAPIGLKQTSCGRKPNYNDIDKYHLKQLWVLTGYMCGKRLKSALVDWLPDYEACDVAVRAKLLKMSTATIDRFLKPARAELRRKKNTHTVPAKYHIKQLIKLREPNQIAPKPGFIESDTVYHCGDYVWGSFGNSVTITDLFSGWTEARCILSYLMTSVH